MKASKIEIICLVLFSIPLRCCLFLVSSENSTQRRTLSLNKSLMDWNRKLYLFGMVFTKERKSSYASWFLLKTVIILSFRIVSPLEIILKFCD